MHLANLTTAGLRKIFILLSAFFIYSFASAQDNSPYSRYGIGDIVPNQNISTRGMGGISAGYSNVLDLNLKNPAALGSLYNTVFDVGGEVDFRTLKSTEVSSKYTATNSLISYLQVGFPLTSAKMKKKNINWGLSFGIRPITRIAYKIEKDERLTGIDSLNTVYEGSGGIHQFNLSTGLKIKNFSIGVSSGYTFGNKDYTTQKDFINDTVAYYKSNTETQAHFGGIFFNTGIQYRIPIRKNGFLKLGAYADFQQSLNAKQNSVNETFSFDGNGGITPIDTINYTNDQAGTIKLPATYGFGFTYQDSSNHWTLGADFEMSNWSSYSYYGEKDENVQNNWTIRAGAEYYPANKNTSSRRYWNFVRYRAGFYLGPDYVKIDQTRFNYAGTLGASFPLTVGRGDFVLLNTALEIGGRGDRQSYSFRENNVRFCIGISMNASWFQKRSYY